jgi:PadR family transcriptional regulator PadR
MEQEELLGQMEQELRRGTLVLCVLTELKKPMYGYSLVGVLLELGVTVEANTLYPLLRRLEGQGLLESEWETGGNKPRKYYRVTQEGAQVRQKLLKAWRKTVETVGRVMEEEEEGQDE